MNLRLKIIAIIISGIFMPLGYYIAICLADGQLVKGFIGLGCCEVLTVVNTWIFWRILGK